VSFLPDWLEPVTRSWSADLLRDSLDEAAVDDVAARLGMVVLLGAIGFAIGYALLARILRHARSRGKSRPRMTSAALVLRYAVVTGFQDYSVTFTWKTWLAGWYVRVLFQVFFFALIGRLLGSEERLHVEFG
jgi:GNAT superfamily N-acetyltransferase